MSAIDYLPAWVKDLGVTCIGTRLHLQRRGRFHRQRQAVYRELRTRSRDELQRYQAERFAELFWRAKKLSPYYARKYREVDEPALQKIPPLEKEELRTDIDDIVIGNKRKLLKVHSGGTTGKAVTLYLSRASMQDRIALLELFWNQHGYHIGQPCAWFSGRRLLGENDRRRNIYWRTSWWLRIRFYSTFDISGQTLPYYLDNLNAYRPKYLSGFPSAIFELGRYITESGLRPSFQPSGIFTTAETLYDEQRAVIESAFGCKVRDQYSSTEGAPWIVECRAGRLHMDLASGIMEIVDQEGNPSDEGEVLATSFTMRETPIIRYRIGDRVRQSQEERCPCGWDTPLVDKILGRTTDYLEIPGRGKTWGAQLGDCVKGVVGVVKFQVELVDQRLLRLYVVPDRGRFTEKDQGIFIDHLRERIGDFPVDLTFVNDLPRSTSGKHQIIRRPAAVGG